MKATGREGNGDSGDPPSHPPPAPGTGPGTGGDLPCCLVTDSTTMQHSFDLNLETASGSRYRVTWDGNEQSGFLARSPATDNDDHPMSHPLRRDGEVLILRGFDRIELGHATTFELDVRGDGHSTFRWANQTVSITGMAWAVSAEPAESP